MRTDRIANPNKDKARKAHNSTIALWKFLFSLLILWRHAETFDPAFAKSHINFIGASIAIFFFFIVSGHLMTAKAIHMPPQPNEIGKTTFQYIYQKVIRFLPYIIVGELGGIIVYVLKGGNLTLPAILNSLFDFSIIPLMFITHQKFLGIAWYICAMLVGMMILYPLILKFRKNFIYICSPLIALFIFSFMSKMSNGSYASADQYYYNFLSKGLLSAIGGLSLGSLAYLLSEKIKITNFTYFAKLLLTLLYITSFISIFVLSCIPGSHQRYDSFMVVLLFIGISISFSGISLFRKFTDNKFIFYLERLSLPVYLNQMWIMSIVHMLLPSIDKFYLFIIISTIATVIVSAAIMLMMDSLHRPAKSFKKLFIKTD